MNEGQDERMEGIEEGVMGLMARMLSVEEENHQLRLVDTLRNMWVEMGRGFGIWRGLLGH